jgi:multimeric flavodoxin WrbA
MTRNEDAMTSIAIVYHSGYGHTKLQAEAVRDGAASVEGTEVTLLTAEEGQARMDELSSMDAIVFGSPTYMGSMSGPMKSFVDATSKPWFSQAWKDKVAGGFTNSGSPSGDKVSTLTAFAILAAQQGMIWVGQGEPNETASEEWSGDAKDAVNRLGGYLGPMAQSENAAPGPDNPPRGDIETARRYGKRIAEAAKRWGSARPE